MARELRRLLIDPERLQQRNAAGGRLPLEQGEQHYLARVLRLRGGDPIAVVDGQGSLWQARIGEGPWLEAFAAQIEAAEQPAPRPSLLLALGLPRREVELIWRMATELGIDQLQPLQAARCQPGERAALARWQAIVREATEQCERLWLPQLHEPCRASDWLKQSTEGLRLLATTRCEGLPLLEQVLNEADRDRSGTISLAIGPEGGWSPEEEQGAIACGWIPVSLDQAILRSATAAVGGAARLAAWRSLSYPSCRGPSP